MKIRVMNKAIIKVLLATGITGAAVCDSDAVVQTSSEVWVGSSTTVKGNGGSGSKVSFFSQRMVRPLQTAGVATGDTASKV